MIPNPSLDCSYVVHNFGPNLSLVVLIKLFSLKMRVYLDIQMRAKVSLYCMALLSYITWITNKKNPGFYIQVF